MAKGKTSKKDANTPTLKIPKDYTVIDVPKDLQEAALLLAQIGEEQRTISEIHTKLNAELEEIQTRLVNETTPHNRRLAGLVTALHKFAKPNRAKLTEDGTKSVELPTGRFGWRLTPFSVRLLGKMTWKKLLAHLQERKLKRFIRMVPEVNREAMIAKRGKLAIPGVEVAQDDRFFVKPTTLEGEIVVDADTLE